MLVVTILLALVAVLLHALLPKTLPYPYEMTPIQELETERAARFPKALEFSKSSTWKSQAKRSLPGNIQILFNGTVVGAESVAIRPQTNQLVMLDQFGFMHFAHLDDETVVMDQGNEALYLGPGRPLGFEFLDKDTLIVADSIKGLVQVKIHGDKNLSQKDLDISILCNSMDGTPINYVNDLGIDHVNQIVYFTSSTRETVAFNAYVGHYDTIRSAVLSMYSGDASGKLLSYNLLTRQVSGLMENIWYANGVTLSPNRDFVLVVETFGFRVLRKWLQTGKEEEFIANLPGAPDGLTRSSDGNFWVSVLTPVSPLFKFVGSPTVRYILSLLHFQLDVAQYFIKKWGCVIKVSPEGEILDVLLDPTGTTVNTVSAVTEHEGKLFLGNLGGPFVSMYDLSATTTLEK